MSFLSNVVGKLNQAISTIAPEVKKNIQKQKEEASSFLSQFNSLNKTNNVDISKIEVDYSLAADEVSEQLLTNREIYRNNNEFNESQNRVKNDLNSANIPDSVKEKLAPMYEELCNATNLDETEAITAQINAAVLSLTQDSKISKDFDELNKLLILNSISASKGKTLSKMNQQLAEVTNDKQKHILQAQIDKTQVDYMAKEAEAHMDWLFSVMPLSDEQKTGLKDLYEKLNAETNDNARDSIKAQINKYCLEQGIDQNMEEMQVINSKAQAVAYHKEMSNLYSKLSCTTDQNQIANIYRQIDLVREENICKLEELDRNILISNMNLDDVTKENILALCEDLSAARNKNEAEKINAKIYQTLMQAGVDLNSEKVANLEAYNLNIQRSKEKLPILEDILQTHDEKALQSLYAELDKLEESYSDQTEELRDKFNQFHNQKIMKNLSSLYQRLSKASSIEERDAILKEIKTIENNENKRNIESNLLNLYLDLQHVSSNAEKDILINKIEGFHSEYKEIELENKLSELKEKFSAAREQNIRSKLLGQIAEINQKIKKKAIIESLYKQLQKCETEQERKRILKRLESLEQ